MRKLAFLIVLLSALSFGQTHTFAARDLDNTWTGFNTFTLTTTFGNVVINGTCTGTGCASGGGSGYATIKNASVAITQRTILNMLGALVCADNAGTLASDCKLATNAAVSNQYLTGIDASGNFLRKQIAYGELSGAPQLPITKAAVASNFLTSYTSTTGLFTAATIANGDLPGAGGITLNTTSPLGGGGTVALGSSLTFTCTACLTSVTAHNLLSVTHGDTTAGTVATGDVITGQSSKWARLALGGTNLYLKSNGTNVVYSTLAASGVGSCPANQFVNANNSDAVPGCAQPAYSGITGTPQLPITKTAVASNWLRSYDSTTGLFTASQPAYNDITGTPQLAITKTAVASNWLRSYDSTTGLFTASQPAFTDISGVGSCAQEPALTGDVTSSGCAATLATTIPNAHTFSGAITTPKLNKSCIVDGTTYTSAASALADTTNCVIP